MNKRKLNFFVIIIGIFIASLAFFIIFNLNRAEEINNQPVSGEEKENSSSFPVAVFLPIWVAVFIPLIAKKNKKGENKELSLTKKRIMTIMLVCTVIIVLLIITVIVLKMAT